jgi:hypothetical protein
MSAYTDPLSHADVLVIGAGQAVLLIVQPEAVGRVPGEDHIAQGRNIGGSMDQGRWKPARLT